jgi:hypothetical protein
VLVPAVQAARERARQVGCKNNLRQIAIACETHHVTHNVYPPGQFLGKYGSGPDSTAWSFLARLLPHLERGDVYEHGNIPDATLRESGVAHLTFGVLRCPSDAQHSARGDRGNLTGFSVGVTNFKGVSGANWSADGSQDLGPGQLATLWIVKGTNGSYDGLDNGDGMLFRSDYRVRRTAAHVLDGLTNTFMLGEDLPDADAYCSWPYANNAYGTCAIPPNYLGGTPTYWPNMLGFRSHHPTGLHFAFCDASARFVSDKIDLAVYRGLATLHWRENASLRD